MIIVSDNTATDIIMERLGVECIDRTMHRLGLVDTHVAHTLREIFADMLPSPDPDQDPYTLARWETEHGVRRDGFSYHLGADNNVSTPREMTRLIEMIFKAELLDRAACDAMLDIEEAAKMNIQKTFNMIVLGGFIKVNPIIQLENVIKGLKKSLPVRYHSLIPMNEKALLRGEEIITQVHKAQHN